MYKVYHDETKKRSFYTFGIFRNEFTPHHQGTSSKVRVNVNYRLVSRVTLNLRFQDESTKHRHNSHSVFSFVKRHRVTLGKYFIQFVRQNVCNEFFQGSCDLVGWPNLSTSSLESFHCLKCSKIEKGQCNLTRSFFRFTNNPFPSCTSALLGILLLGIVSTTWVEWVVLEWLSRVLNFVEWQPLSLVGVVRRSIVLLSQCLSRVSYCRFGWVNLILQCQSYVATHCTCRVLSFVPVCYQYTMLVEPCLSFGTQHDTWLNVGHPLGRATHQT